MSAAPNPVHDAGVALPDRARLRALLDSAAAGLLERDHAVRLALLAALAGEHVLLIGPPGTAKSALARRLHGGFADTRYFERLLTRFSTPEELFGPLSLKALEDDRYERLTDGFLPTAGIAFLDEVFKANSAILNALLTLLNEREFDNGTARLRTPLVAVVAASNEVPADEALHAFYDRFLVRVPVAPVGDAQFDALLALPDDEHPAPDQPLTSAEREAVHAAAQRVRLGENFLVAARALRAWLAQRDAPMSDRRWRQLVGLVRTAAATEGRTELEPLDLWLAPYVASRSPQDVPALISWFEDEALALPPRSLPGLERAVSAFERQLELELAAPAEGGDADSGAGKLALARAIGLGEGAGVDAAPGMQRIVSVRLEAQASRRWSPVHVQARIAQVDGLAQQLQQLQAASMSAASALRAALAQRVWVPTASAEAWIERHGAALGMLRQLIARLAPVRDGFTQLPQREVGADDALPSPVAWTQGETEGASALA